MSKKLKIIMLVDDEEDQLFTIKTAFDMEYKNEYQILPAKGGSECFKFLKQNVIPDLILLDIMMPHMSGWEVYDKLKEKSQWKDIPIVFLSARTDSIATEAGTFLGDEYIEKPVDANELKNKLDKIFKIK